MLLKHPDAVAVPLALAVAMEEREGVLVEVPEEEAVQEEPAAEPLAVMMTAALLADVVNAVVYVPVTVVLERKSNSGTALLVHVSGLAPLQVVVASC